MSNPFDQFDTPAAAPTTQGTPNPFDQFDNHPGSAVYDSRVNPNSLALIPPTTPKTHYTLWEALKAIPGNSAKSVYNLGKGVWNAYLHPIDTAEAAVNTTAGIPAGAAEIAGGSALKMLTPQVRDMIVSDDPAKFQPMIDAANKMGGHYVDRYGTYDAIKRTLAEDPIGFAADASTLFTGAGGLARGVAAGAAGVGTRVAASAAARGLETAGQLINPISPRNVVGRLMQAGADRLDVHPVNALARAANNAALGPQNALVMGAAEGQAPRIQGLLEDANQLTSATTTAGELVPGSVPTAAQVVAPEMNATRFASLGKDAQKLLPTRAADLQDQRNAARLAQVRQLGRDATENQAAFGHPVMDPETADTLHEALARRDYAAANRVISRGDAGLMDLLGRPDSELAVSNARRAAEQAGEDFQIGSYSPAVQAHSIPSGVLGPNGQPVMINVPAQPAVFPQYNGRNLQRLKEEFDGLIYGKGNAGEPNLTPARRTALLDTRNQVVDWINSNNDPWRQARENYGIRANIIDRMRMGDVFADKLTSPVTGDDTSKLLADSFGRALDGPENAANVNPTIRNATGKPRANQVADIVTPEELNLLNSVNADLAREKMAEQQGNAATSEHGGSLKTSVSDWLAGGHTVGNPGIARSVVNALLAGQDSKVANRVGNAMLTPQGAQQILTNALNRQQNIDRARNIAGRLINAYPAAAVRNYPAVYNMLQDERDKADAEKRNAFNR